MFALGFSLLAVLLIFIPYLFILSFGNEIRLPIKPDLYGYVYYPSIENISVSKIAEDVDAIDGHVYVAFDENGEVTLLSEKYVKGTDALICSGYFDQDYNKYREVYVYCDFDYHIDRSMDYHYAVYKSYRGNFIFLRYE